MSAPWRETPSFAGPAAALGILAELGVLRAVLAADDARAYFLGHPIPFVCGLHARTGIPCPMCGITRAVAFTLHGDVLHAFGLNPAAPLAVLGLLFVASGLLGGAFVTARYGARAGARFSVSLRRGAVLYAAAGAAAWLLVVTARAAEALAMR
jgi:hypothetical protein